MTTGHRFPLFVSSVHYGLEDLRAELIDFLESLGVQPYASSEAGFPDYHGMPPYAGCLRALERCLMVVGILDRRYGRAFDDWGPFPQYKGLSPTHAELRHALALGKRFVVYVRDDVHAIYELYRRNPDDVAKLNLPDNLDVQSLELYRELKLAKPAPWIEPFRDVRDLKASLQQRLLNDLYELMLQREATTNAAISVITDAFVKSDRSLRDAVLAAADKETQAQIGELDRRLTDLAEKRKKLEDAHAETARAQEDLTQQMNRLAEERARLQQFISATVARLVAGAVTSGLPVAALNRVAGPENLPLVTDQELSRGGIHFSGYSQAQPTVSRVTWSRLPQQDPRGIHRGYDAALQVFGVNFAPGCKIQVRRKGSNEEPTFGWVPNIFSGHYLELSTNASDETPIGDLSSEYRVVNPMVGRASEWVAFSYTVDHEAEVKKAMDLFEVGESAFKAGDFKDAIEPLRSAHVRLAALVGSGDERWGRANSLWQEALYESGTWTRLMQPAT
jgi:molecular chaperone GrpE (heat shock protein)